MSEPIIQSLMWRYATKKFDPSKKLTQEQISTLEEALRLSASSFGIQPWKFFIITNPEVREKLKVAAFGQPQVGDASHLVVFTQHVPYGEKQVDALMADVAQTKGIDVAMLGDYKKMIMNRVSNSSQDVTQAWTARQVYIALGTLLTSAAIMKIDACPMEGFDPKKFDEILGLKAMGLESLVMCALGFRSADDAAAIVPKTRFPKEDVIVEIK